MHGILPKRRVLGVDVKTQVDHREVVPAVLLSRDVVFNESQFMSFEKEPSKEIESVPCSFPQEEKHEDSEGELELRRSIRNRAAPDRFGGWV
ncbi:hypothetical protein FHG87_020219 [Trinorchestia longiramus]|nr:hypothetical protein FHG87_020219 [Trinorchestia longiramus]